MLRQLARPSSQLAHVNRAIAIICSRYDVEATLVSVDVGYESTSQFNREYRRLFGKPPGRDAAEARRAIEANVPAAYGRAY